MPYQSVTARANANIALIKYWGKWNEVLNVPAVGSLSLTLDEFGTTTTLQAKPQCTQNRFFLNGQEQTDASLERVDGFINNLKQKFNYPYGVEVISYNQVPTASGFASSSSGFAALCLAACTLMSDTPLSLKELAQLARRGSGSAARSFFGDFCAILPPAYATEDVFPIALQAHPDLQVSLLGICCALETKPLSSSLAMQLTKSTSPYYAAFVESHSKDLYQAIWALKQNQFDTLGTLMEASTFKMHASMMAANPPIIYWNSNTFRVLEWLKKIRKEGLGVYSTMDAGPHVKLLCKDQDLTIVQKTLKKDLPDLTCYTLKPGPGAQVLECT